MADPLDLAAIEARCQAATEGPWRHYSGQSVYGPESTAVDIAEATLKADATFIAHARTDIPALCAEVHRLQADNLRMMRGVAEIHRRTTESHVPKTRDVSTFEAMENLLAGREWSDAEVE